jgi:hypothetical protein
MKNAGTTNSKGFEVNPSLIHLPDADLFDLHRVRQKGVIRHMGLRGGIEPELVLQTTCAVTEQSAHLPIVLMFLKVTNMQCNTKYGECYATSVASLVFCQPPADKWQPDL